MVKRVRVGVVDPHPLFREGVIRTLAAQDDMAIIGQGGNVDDVIRIARESVPDVIVLEPNFPGGITAIRTVAVAYPTVNVLVLTALADKGFLAAAMAGGARGYLLKSASGPELVGTVRALSCGETFESPGRAAQDEGEASLLVDRMDLGPAASLTRREQELLTFLSRGLTNREIGMELELTENTVKYYLNRLMKKLKVRNRVEAAMLAQDRVLG
jgi:two-component system, NarL family, nitrate/nitrite response regulator NarL